jgi:hypothetical protein
MSITIGKQDNSGLVLPMCAMMEKLLSKIVSRVNGVPGIQRTELHRMRNGKCPATLAGKRGVPLKC